MMRRLMEYSESCVRMPASSAGMPIKVCSSPVTSPATSPAINAPSIAAHTFQPASMSMIQVAAPVVIEPSTVKSATSSTL